MSAAVPFVVFDQRSGAIARSGICAPDMVQAQAVGPNELALQVAAPVGNDADITHRVVDGGLVPIDPPPSEA